MNAKSKNHKYQSHIAPTYSERKAMAHAIKALDHQQRLARQAQVYRDKLSLLSDTDTRTLWDKIMDLMPALHFSFFL